MSESSAHRTLIDGLEESNLKLCRQYDDLHAAHDRLLREHADLKEAYAIIERVYAVLLKDADRWREELSQAKLQLERKPLPTSVCEELENELGTSDMAEAVAVVRGLKEQAKLAEIIERLPEGMEMTIYRRRFDGTSFDWVVHLQRQAASHYNGFGCGKALLEAAEKAMIKDGRR